jgi:O-antigen/teichoic acid export membrane protein
LFSGIYVGIYIARYLGPENFGVLSYVTAIVAIYSVFCGLGMESILVKELSSRPNQQMLYLGTGFWLVLAASILSFISLVLYTLFYESSVTLAKCIYISSVALLFQPLIITEYYFQSNIQANYSSIARIFALIISAFIKLFLIFIDASLIYFLVIYAFDTCLVGISLLTIFIRKNKAFYIKNFKINKARKLLLQAGPMVASSLASILYMRLDQLMIKDMLTVQDVGQYSAAVKIYEAWVMVTVALTLSLIPAIVKLRYQLIDQYQKQLTILFRFVFWLSIAMAMLFTIFGSDIMNLTFGNAYDSAIGVLKIVMWTAPFAALGSVTNRYLVVENLQKIIVLKTIISLIFNGLLNVFLIPRYGIEGAAWATLITVILANFLYDFLDQRLRVLRKMKLDAILFRSTKT